MGVMVWSPLAKGMLTGRYRKGQPLPDSLRVKVMRRQMSDEHRLDAVEQLIVVAREAGIPLTHLAMAFAVSHPGVTSAILGPRTMEQLDDLLAGAEAVLSDGVLDAIDRIVPPGTDVGVDAANYVPPALSQPFLRRRPIDERAAS
jgi:aryl-alcohol dehydrogenase-like predicted oxidoreductase